jgi:hypothetical protein
MYESYLWFIVIHEWRVFCDEVIGGTDMDGLVVQTTGTGLK